MDIIAGIQHVTVVGADLTKSKAFYSGILGLTAMKPSEATISSAESFVLKSGRSSGSLSVVACSAKEDRGRSASVGAIVFSTQAGSLPDWGRHFADKGVSVAGRAWAFGEEHLCFNDPDGLNLALVEHSQGERGDDAQPRGALRPLEIHAIELNSNGAEDELYLLLSLLRVPLRAREGPLFRFTIGGPPPTGHIDVFSKVRTAPWPVARSHIRNVALEVTSADALVSLADTLAQHQFKLERRRGEDRLLWVRLTAQFGFDIALCLAGQSEADLIEPDLKHQS